MQVLMKILICTVEMFYEKNDDLVFKEEFQANQFCYSFFWKSKSMVTKTNIQIFISN